MAQTFEDISKEVVNRFLQNILFIDDKAYLSENKANDFDASKISMVFAKEGKLCTVYAPSTVCDLCICSSLFSKSDVIVLDWYLDLKDDNQAKGDEEDADVDEPRGYYSKKLIEEIVVDAKDNKLKLIIIYTGETDLHAITKDVYELIQKYGHFTLDDCCVFSTNVLILIRAKYNGEEQFKHQSELKSKVVKYEELPDFITTVFAGFVNGLLPNYALSVISSIRENTSQILNVFSKDIDAAFMGHYISIPDSSDAVFMLSKIFGAAITNLIDVSNFDVEHWIESWIDENIKERTVTINGKNIIINAEILKEIVMSIDNFETTFNHFFSLKINEYQVDSFKKDSINLFSMGDAETSNYKWAKLVQHSNLFSSPKVHQLRMGTILKYQNGDDWKYLICIQQSCDSVRIQKGEERSFLFLPLIKGIKGEAVVIEGNDHLIVDGKSYSIELYKFSPINEMDTQIIAQIIDNERYIFIDKDGRQFVWLAELKEMFAQHIVSAYASQLSRVGIDNSEWIRLLGKKTSK